MAGPQDIQRYPRGLIDLLGMRATGETPHQLGKDLAPVLEQLDLYLLDRQRQIQTSTTTVSSLGNLLFPSMTVPSGELWFVYEITLQIPAVAAASSVRAMLAVYRSQTGTNLPLGVAPSIDALALQANAIGVHFEKPLLMTPAQSIGVFTSFVTGTPGVAYQGTVNYAAVLA
jgi:hypothetical protein